MHAATKLVVVLASLSSQIALARDSGDVPGPPAELRREYRFEDSRKTVLKLYPGPMVRDLVIGAITNTVFLTVPVEMELGVHPNLGLSGLVTPVVAVGGGYETVGIALNGGARVYPFGHAPDGFWLGGQLGVSWLMSPSGSLGIIEVQPQLGYQWILDNGFTIGLGAGYSLSSSVEGQNGFTFMVPVGYAW
ncbi:MAG TPA: hypothetical protein VIG99_31255 [Myxococcaceae bacterium]|jgi:hypothetical protein